MLLFASCNSAPEQQQNECEQFRNGEFWYQHEGQSRYSIIRKDSIQQEIEHTSGKMVTLSVKWISPCEYELRYISSMPAEPDSVQAAQKAMVLKTTITRTGEDFYEYSSRAEGADFVLKGTLRRLKK